MAARLTIVPEVELDLAEGPRCALSFTKPIDAP
jgi:hypothetical protein